MRSLFSKMPKSFAFALKWLIRISLQVPTVVARHGRIKFSLILVFYHFHISMKSFLVPIADITQVWWKQSQDENVNNKKRKKKASSVTFMRSFCDSFSASYPQAPRNSLLCDCHENSGRPAGQLWLRPNVFYKCWNASPCLFSHPSSPKLGISTKKNKKKTRMC